MQPTTKRKSPRRPVRYPASIELDGGEKPIQCTLCDASRDGAQLQVADPTGLPSEFTLVLGYHGTARRRCEVVSRTDNQVEVEFMKAAAVNPSLPFQPRRADRPIRAE